MNILALRPVTPNRTTFMQGYNLFNGIFNNVLYPNNGVLLSVADGSVRTAIIRIEADKTYKIQTIGPHNRFRLGAFNDTTYGSRGINIVEKTSSGNEYYEYTNTGGYSYLFVYVSNSQEEPEIIVKDADLSLKVDGEVKTLYDASFVEGSNLFKNTGYYNDLALGIFTGGGIPVLQLISTTGGKTLIMKIEGGKTYKVERVDRSNRFRIALFETEHPPKVGDLTSKIVNLDNDINFIEIPTSTEDTYLVITVSVSGETPLLIIRDRDLSIDGITVKPLDTFKKYARYYDGDLITSSVPSTTEAIHSMYDELMNKHPGYVEKTVLGTTRENQELVEYKFSRPQMPGIVTPKLKIGITTGVHGNEIGAVYGLLKFMEDLCNNPNDNEILNRIKSYADIHIIPVVNPYGFDRRQRTNGAGVNINRNFTTNWILTEEGSTYSGPSPASEPETQIVENWLQDNNFDHFIDFHNWGSTATYGFSYFVPHPTQSSELSPIYNRAMSVLSTVWAKRYPSIPQNEVLGEIQEYLHYLASAQAQGYASGAKSVTLEAPAHIVELDTNPYGLYTRTMALDIIGNYLFELYKKYLQIHN